MLDFSEGREDNRPPANDVAPTAAALQAPPRLDATLLAVPATALAALACSPAASLRATAGLDAHAASEKSEAKEEVEEFEEEELEEGRQPPIAASFTHASASAHRPGSGSCGSNDET